MSLGRPLHPLVRNEGGPHTEPESGDYEKYIPHWELNAGHPPITTHYNNGYSGL